MTRRQWLLAFLGLLAAALGSGVLFALTGTHPAWMAATFAFSLGAVISGALFITSP